MARVTIGSGVAFDGVTGTLTGTGGGAVSPPLSSVQFNSNGVQYGNQNLVFTNTGNGLDPFGGSIHRQSFWLACKATISPSDSIEPERELVTQCVVERVIMYARAQAAFSI